ncbi:doxx family protein [Tenacibaculum tangerinum]|uniref:Doxx family protein n=1 Tax=Tenacibaculum tangerinum TaxID=3038772 RepID=A0ABY8L5I3_9FLAO|nr:doxx family protein [Tenacibaculum tangerinum]WGH75299.1 doxx family protein [Tenacibaculum tangerinum]
MKLLKLISQNHILAITIGFVYLWFGGLKYFPGKSPAEELAINTINSLTFSLIPSNISIILLAIWETLVGLLLILNLYRRPVIIATLVHLVFTFTPLFFFPQQSFGDSPFTLTLLGQYIIKNVIIIGALLTLYNQIDKEASHP